MPVLSKNHETSIDQIVSKNQVGLKNRIHSKQVRTKNIVLPGAIGKLEAVIDEPANLQSQYQSNDFIAVCCHPHPQHGGTMSNKVIYTASRTLSSLGITSIRFNYRGVGKSDGEYADGIGEQKDLVSIVKWVQEHHPKKKIVLCGFSFGAHISAMQASSLNANALISIAPPVGRITFEEFKRPKANWLIIQGDQDELVDVKKVKQWSLKFSNKPEVIIIKDASHFFHGKLIELRTSIESFCNTVIFPMQGKNE